VSFLSFSRIGESDLIRSLVNHLTSGFSDYTLEEMIIEVSMKIGVSERYNF